MATATGPGARRVRAVVRRLEKAYGPRPWKRHGPPLDGLIAAILSQNTSDQNSHAAFKDLKRRFPTWERVRTAPASKIAAAIKTGGLAQQKAPRIKKILNQLHKKTGELSLDFLRDLSLDQAREYLLALSGVGPKTAACVLMFNLGRPALPVDTHVHRVAKRIGLIDPSTSADKAHHVLERACPDELIYPFHVLMIAHGRQVCHARSPPVFSLLLERYLLGPQADGLTSALLG